MSKEDSFIEQLLSVVTSIINEELGRKLAICITILRDITWKRRNMSVNWQQSLTALRRCCSVYLSVLVKSKWVIDTMCVTEGILSVGSPTDDVKDVAAWFREQQCSKNLVG